MDNQQAFSPEASVCIFAWNEQEVISRALQSLFEQSLFGEMAARGQSVEVICVVNGSTDATVSVAEKTLHKLKQEHPYRNSFSARVENLVERGKVNAWNQYVHRLSHPRAEAFFMMDADITINRRETLWSMFECLQSDPVVSIAVDRPRKDLEFKLHPTFVDRLSLAAGRATISGAGQVCGQLYCIRSAVARKIFLPRDLAACEDGFLKWAVCTDLFSREPVAGRIRTAPNAEHTFEAYTSPGELFKNQQRQIIGQTIVHVLVDQHLKQLPVEARKNLAETLREAENSNPDWLKVKLADHLRGVSLCWQLYPYLATQRFRSLRHLPWAQRLRSLPAAAAASAVTLAASFPAMRKLKNGRTSYWPKATRSSAGLSPSTLT
jgi:glycosyltransferase involved in cell wall biosynthesis